MYNQFFHLGLKMPMHFHLVQRLRMCGTYLILC